ncbi:hypothetical protein SLJ66_001989 [Escherichia coli]|nr:hypothetical protein [Escherichia coli]
MSEEFKDWVKDVSVCQTLGGDIQVRLDGSSIFDEVNKYGIKARHSFMVGERFASKEEATKYAIDWLQGQIDKLQERAA